MLESKRIIISGNVQGVGMRYEVNLKAAELNLKGHVRNLEDGTVEILCKGENEDINELVGWLEEKAPGENKKISQDFTQIPDKNEDFRIIY